MTAHSIVAVAVTAALALGLAVPASAASRPGSHDRSFGGAATPASIEHPELVGTLAGGSDGRLTYAGVITSMIPLRDLTQSGLVVRRVLPNGAPDPSFGGDGHVELVGGPHDWSARPHTVRTPDGGVLVGLTRSAPGSEPTLRLVRLTRTGAPDASFGPGGVRVIPVPSQVEYFDDLILDSAARIVVLASSAERAGAWVGRFHLDGSVDPAFGDRGGTWAPFGQVVREHAGGGLVVAGPIGIPGARIARLTERGTLDPSFGQAGVAEIAPSERSFGLTDVAALPDGRLRIAGEWTRRTAGGFAVAGLGSAGEPDRRFSRGGLARVPAPPRGRSNGDAKIAIDGRGRVVLAGVRGVDAQGRVELVRLLPSGALDLGFGRRGRSVSEDESEFVRGLVIQPEGRIVALRQSWHRYIGGGHPGLYGYHGGHDLTKPRVWLGGLPRRCARGSLRLRLRVVDASPLAAAQILLDGRRVHRGTAKRAVIGLSGRRLRRGAHRVRVYVRDGSGNVTRRALRFRSCR